MTLLILDAVDHADGLHRPDELVDLLRREQVLLDLVGDDAVAGLFDGQARERFGVRRDGGGHGIDDGVDLGLRKLGEDELAPAFARRASARASAMEARSLSVCAGA